ncbi:MAG: M3 family oligoendopeptidase [Ardenticatenales bacterium]|nr:M3 family oligoendopeptidase [Ardenticatenales bacterium]
MFETLPDTATDFMAWTWADIEPYFADLLARKLDEASVESWLSDWTRLAELVQERFARLSLANTQDTRDEAAEARFHAFLSDIQPKAQKASHQLDERLLASGLEPAGFEIPLRNMRSDAALFREENLPLRVAEQKLGSEYNKIVGNQTIEWHGETKTLPQLGPLFETPDRPVRQELWQKMAGRVMQDRESLNALWQQLIENRRQQGANVGLENYRALRWRMLRRFEYTPEDCETFHRAIEEAVVPAASRIYARAREAEALDSLRPWDVRGDVYTFDFPAYAPFEDVAELEARSEVIFSQVDPQLGGYFSTMRQEGLLDLPNRPGKGPGGFCTTFANAKRPFIFMNAVGTGGDVRTMLHECGHAFHVFQNSRLPFIHQRRTTSEFNEVASMAMELLASPYIEEERGGFFAVEEAARYRRSHLEKIILFWPYMAVVDAFQHWVYTSMDQAVDPMACDAKWAELWDRFMPGIDFSGYEDWKQTGWHRKLHIFRLPFYYVEYGLAQMGALQVWRNSLTDQAGAVRQYKQALALGGTQPIPALFSAAGARFGFDTELMTELVDLIETTIAEL